MSQNDYVSVEFRMEGLTRAAGAATNLVVRGVGATLSNENLEKAARELCPSVQIAGPTMIVTTSEGITLRFEGRGKNYRPVLVGQADPKKVQQALGRLTQRYAVLQIQQIANKRNLPILSEKTEADGQVRIRLRAQPGVPDRPGEVSADIGPDGRVRLEAHGMRGPSCVEALDPIVEALGVVLEESKKAEYYESEWLSDEDREEERTS